jgi:hypothetical protein
MAASCSGTVNMGAIGFGVSSMNLAFFKGGLGDLRDFSSSCLEGGTGSASATSTCNSKQYILVLINTILKVYNL